MYLKGAVDISHDAPESTPDKCLLFCSLRLARPVQPGDRHIEGVEDRAERHQRIDKAVKCRPEVCRRPILDGLPAPAAAAVPPGSGRAHPGAVPGHD